MAKRITENHNADGIDRRGFLECMAWARHARQFQRRGQPHALGVVGTH